MHHDSNNNEPQISSIQCLLQIILICGIVYYHYVLCDGFKSKPKLI